MRATADEPMARRVLCKGVIFIQSLVHLAEHRLFPRLKFVNKTLEDLVNVFKVILFLKQSNDTYMTLN